MKKKNIIKIEKYLHQESSLPLQVKEILQRQLKGDERIELYALIDLSTELNIVGDWIILTTKRVFIITQKGSKKTYRINVSFEIESISKVKEITSISCHTLIFITADDLPSLATINYTKRQSVVMGTLSYVIQERIKKSDQKFNFDLDADSIYQNGIMKSINDVQNNVYQNKSTILWRLLSYLLPYKKELIIGCIGAVLTTIVALIPAYISGYLIDNVVRPFQDDKLNIAEAMKIGWLLLGCFALIYVLREFFLWIRLKKMSILGELVAKDLRGDLFSHIQTLGMDFFSSKQTGSIISRVSSDTDRIWDFVAFGVVEVGIALITLFSLGVVLILLDWKLGIVMTLPVPLLLYSIFVHGERMKKMFLKAWRKWSDLTNVLSDTIPGMQVVKAFTGEDRERKRFNKVNDIALEEFEEIHNAWTSFWPLLMIGIHSIIFTVWVMAVPRLLARPIDGNHLTAGTFISFLLYMTMFTQPIEVIGQVARMLNRALSSAYRIFEILDTKPTMKECEHPAIKSEIHGKIEFQDVVFSYDGVRNVIKGINFEIKPGEMIGLVGESGGGKSTITKLIARFYDVTSGKILIDGEEIRNLDTSFYRRNVAMVMQDPYLFHGSICDNIAYGKPEATIEEILEAARIANAHQFIGKLPYGYDTVVGERGHTLSGGERQRISIARAVLINPSILILDEATSAVDTETERKIQIALDRIIEGRTVFAVAHRLSTLRKADRIFVVENGVIKEKGNHQELLAKENGSYKKLHSMQQEMNQNFVV